MTAAVLMMLGLLASAPTAASADVGMPVAAWGWLWAAPPSLASTGATAIAAGGYHGLALTPGGEVVAWGNNISGQTDVPSSLAGKTVTAVAGGEYHSLALTSEGRVVAWGDDGEGQTDVPASLAGRTVVAIAAGGYHNLALTSDGQVVGWGSNRYGQASAPVLPAGTTVVMIAAGGYHNLALTSNGRVVAWGQNNSNQTEVPASLTGKAVTAISAGGWHSFALTSDGRITGWGWNSEGQRLVPVSLTGKTVIDISAGGYHTLALTSDGHVTGWGYEGGQSSVPSSIDGKVTAISDGLKVSLGLTQGVAPKVTLNPRRVSVEPGAAAWFNATATGSPRPAVQWQRADPGTAFRDIPGATGLTYTLNPVAADDAARFRAVFTNASGTATTDAAGLTVNSPPTARSLDVAVPFGSAVPVTLAGGDPEGDPLSYAVVRQPAHGSLSGHLPTLRYTPTQGFTGPDSFTYTVNDGRAVSPEATVTIRVAAEANAAPTARSFDVTTAFESTIPVTLSGTDPDGDALAYAVVRPPSHGTLSGDPPALRYTPARGYNGPDSFTYAVNDGRVSSSPATVTIRVAKKPNAAPTATDVDVTTSFESAIPITLSGTDPDGDTLRYTLAGRPAHGTLSGTAPALTYVPADGYAGPDAFTYRVDDGSLSSRLAKVTVSVSAQSCTPSQPKLTFRVDADQNDTNAVIRSPKFKTKKSGQLLVAFVSANGPVARPQAVTEVSGGHLTWTLVRRQNTGGGTSEIWQAYAPEKLSSTRVTANLITPGYSATMTVAGFSRARRAVGSAGHQSGAQSAPHVSVTPQVARSTVWATGRVIGSRYQLEPISRQKIVHSKTFKYPEATYWTQRSTAPTTAGTPVRISDKARAESWGYTAAEIRGTCG